jgi:hypothetical protein
MFGRLIRGAIRVKKLSLILGIGFLLIFLAGVGVPARAADTGGLTGIVSSAAEGPMEGVLVSAKRFQEQ